MAGNIIRKKILVKRLLILGLVGILIFGLSGWLLFRLRNERWMMRLTNNNYVFRTINELAKITDIPFSYYYFYKNELPTYQLFIKGQDFEKLQNTLPDPNQRISLLTEDNAVQVPAVFIDDIGKNYKAAVRHRGNTTAHWGYAKKSWRIILKDLEKFKNLNSIDLIIPEDRGLALGLLSNYRAKKLGLEVPDAWFVNLKVNQKTHGVYYAVERIDENFLSRRGLKGTLFVEKDDVSLWNKPLYVSTAKWKTYPENPNNPDFKHLKRLIELINNPETTADQLLEIIDIDNFIKWQVHSVLMASFAQDKIRNNRLFYNYEIDKFQFIPWDTGSRHQSFEDLDRDYHPIVDKLLADPEIWEQRNKLLNDYISNPDNLEDDKRFFEAKVNEFNVPLMQDGLKFYANFKYLRDIREHRRWLDQHFDNLLFQLNN